MSEANAKTLDSYDANIEGYIKGTPQETVQGVKAWLDAAIATLPLNPIILEVGAGFGRRTEYLATHGLHAVPTDASRKFVEAMKHRGHSDAYQLDLLADDLPPDQDMILADAVLLHFTDEQVKTILSKMHSSLKPNGVLAVSIKKGSGEEWVNDKLGLPRFFHYWSSDEFSAILAESGFEVKYVSDDSSGRNNSEWLSFIAQPNPINQ